jgi:hypothetical protein
LSWKGGAADRGGEAPPEAIVKEVSSPDHTQIVRKSGREVLTLWAVRTKAFVFPAHGIAVHCRLWLRPFQSKCPWGDAVWIPEPGQKTSPAVVALRMGIELSFHWQDSATHSHVFVDEPHLGSRPSEPRGPSRAELSSK